MLIVGLTGGIASGKTFVSRILRDLGAHVIDADRIVHELLAPGQDANREVIGHFGKAIGFTDGSIDRRKLGNIVFNDPAERAWLNSLLHPRVFDVYHAQAKQIAGRDPRAVIVLDAALLVETGYYRKMEKLIVVYADPADQISRLTERDRFTREQAQARIESQMPLTEKKNYADYVIDNSGSREATERQVREVFEKLRKEASKTE